MAEATIHLYAIALGSNRPHHRHGPPKRIISAALARLCEEGVTVRRSAPVIETPPLGPSLRRYANSAALIETALPPLALLALLKRIEREFGRRPGRRWGTRVLDLDIILWSGGSFRSPRLTIPHAQFRARDFVLLPLTRIAPHWRDPGSGLTIRQLSARLTRAKPVDQRRPRP